jgi:hypothetical protein
MTLDEKDDSCAALVLVRPSDHERVCLKEPKAKASQPRKRKIDKMARLYLPWTLELNSDLKNFVTSPGPGKRYNGCPTRWARTYISIHEANEPQDLLEQKHPNRDRKAAYDVYASCFQV